MADETSYLRHLPLALSHCENLNNGDDRLSINEPGHEKMCSMSSANN